MVGSCNGSHILRGIPPEWEGMGPLLRSSDDASLSFPLARRNPEHAQRVHARSSPSGRRTPASESSRTPPTDQQSPNRTLEAGTRWLMWTILERKIVV